MAPKTRESWPSPIDGILRPETSSPARRRQQAAFPVSSHGLSPFSRRPCRGRGAAASSERTYLADGWAIQSSAKVHAPGETISSPEYKPVDWYKATVPSTVVGNLIDDGGYPDPFFGMNLRSIPGMEYPVGTNFSGTPMPANSPFKASWWYRKEFGVTPERDGQVWLNFDGINYRANIWLNGKLVADTNRVAGAYRTYTFNVTGSIQPRKPNVLAVEVFPPDVNSLAITWVDWNPMPPDKNMGLWRDVYVTTTGPVALRYPQVLTKVDLPSLNQAHLIVSAELENAGDRRSRPRSRGRSRRSGSNRRSSSPPTSEGAWSSPRTGSPSSTSTSRASGGPRNSVRRISTS